MVVGQTAVSSQSVGLERVRCYLLSREDTFAVADGTDPFDWYWVGKSGSVKTIPVTTWSDSFERDVLYVEQQHDNQIGKIAAAADYLFYYYLLTKVCYIIPMTGLREVAKEYWQTPQREMTIRSGEKYIISRGIEVPLSDVLAIPRVRKETI